MIWNPWQVVEMAEKNMLCRRQIILTHLFVDVTALITTDYTDSPTHPHPLKKIWKESSISAFSLTLFCLCVYMCSVSNGAIETLSVEWISRIDLKPTQPQGIIAHFLSLALFFPFLMKQISFLFSPKTDHLLLWSRHLKAFLNHPHFTGEPGKLQSTMHMSTRTLWHRDSLINTTGTSFMLGVYAPVCLTFYYIVSDVDLIFFMWSFVFGRSCVPITHFVGWYRDDWH